MCAFVCVHVCICVCSLSSIKIIIVDDSIRDEFIRMRPDESRTIALILLNGGQSSNFTIADSMMTTTNDDTADTADTTEVFLEASPVITGPIFLEEGSSTEIEIIIRAFGNVTGGKTLMLTVLVESSIDRDISDFITLPVMISERTTAPPTPESTEFITNVRHHHYRLFA